MASRPPQVGLLYRSTSSCSQQSQMPLTLPGVLVLSSCPLPAPVCAATPFLYGTHLLNLSSPGLWVSNKCPWNSNWALDDLGKQWSVE